jgi:WS/DGAT/MGAT family acyltransferase
MKQLSGVDSMFLRLDNPRASTGGTMVLVYDQTTRPCGKPLRFKEILAHFESRIAELPVLQQKLVRVPFGLDHPYWVKDKNFSLEHHVHHVRLPLPGDWRQFCILAARLTTPHFDFARPLWEMYVVEGLDNVDGMPEGSFGLLIRVHHAAVDGSSAVQILQVLHELGAEEPKKRRKRKNPGSNLSEDPPGLTTILFNAGVNNTRNVLRLSKPIWSLASQLLPRPLMDDDDELEVESAAPLKAPATRFNDKVSPYRVFGTRSFPFDIIRSLRKLVEGATVNDVVATLISGALRRYLLQHGELPEDSMVAMMPINTRASQKEYQTEGNAIVLARSAIRTDIEDPIERLEAVRCATAGMKSFVNGVGAGEMTDLTRFAPEATLAFAGKLLAKARLDGGGFGRPLFNVGISNVPGPREPLYLMGARLRHFSIVVPLVDGMGLGFGVISYAGELSIFPTACRDIVPDPDFLLECLDESFAEMRALVSEEDDE